MAKKNWPFSETEFFLSSLDIREWPIFKKDWTKNSREWTKKIDRSLILVEFFFGQPKKLRNWPDNWSAKRLTKTKPHGRPSWLTLISESDWKKLERIVRSKRSDYFFCLDKKIKNCQGKKTDQKYMDYRNNYYDWEINWAEQEYYEVS